MKRNDTFLKQQHAEWYNEQENQSIKSEYIQIYVGNVCVDRTIMLLKSTHIAGNVGKMSLNLFQMKELKGTIIT